MITLWIHIILGLFLLWLLKSLIVALFFQREMRAARERDPASLNSLNVILNYPGPEALLYYRVAHALFKLGVPLIPRTLSQIARILTGIEIHPGAVIGKGLFIDHGMGVVIGETTVIGDEVTLFQGVTLGGTGKETGKRHPTLGNLVVVGTGAKILGSIQIGDHVTIGANAVVVRDVPSHSTVVGVPGRIVSEKGRHFPGINLDHTHLPDPLAQSIEKLQHEIDHLEAEIKRFKKNV